MDETSKIVVFVILVAIVIVAIFIGIPTLMIMNFVRMRRGEPPIGYIPPPPQPVIMVNTADPGYRQAFERAGLTLETSNPRQNSVLSENYDSELGFAIRVGLSRAAANYYAALGTLSQNREALPGLRREVVDEGLFPPALMEEMATRNHTWAESLVRAYFRARNDTANNSSENQKVVPISDKQRRTLP